MSREALERQRAFTGLLAQPVVDRRVDPELFALVRHPRHRTVLLDWFATRLGYRLVITDGAARLFRLPLHGVVVAPERFEPPPRRALVLAVLAAAAAEDAEDVTTTQDLSDRVRALTDHPDVEVAGYDPDRWVERQLFGRSVGLLVQAGALRPTTRDADDQREGWAAHRGSVGGAYEVERELLLRMVDPASLAAALSETDGRDGGRAEATTRFSLMRRLIELPVCLLADLDDAERAYLTSQRHRVLAWCTEMTGWVVEQRAEGLALIPADESGTDLPFPRIRAVHFAALMLLDELVARQDERGQLPDALLDEAAAGVRARHSRAMSKELATDRAVRDRSLDLLRALDLLRPVPGTDQWWVSPAAARFRHPQVVSVSSKLDGNWD